MFRGGHFSTLRTKIKDAEILKATLRDLGIVVKTEADVRGYNGQRVRSDVVAVLEGEYDIGWNQNSDGSYDLIADLWGVGKNHNQMELIRAINYKYAVNKTLAELKQRGVIKKMKCPRCTSTQIGKYGYFQGKQNYICRNCGTQFADF
ncbi:MAG: DUF1257 domain-containing protein [Scytonema sp. RU_4_4]|nr:DUF1257 domain-containing protein [Scytonema sp. RU_4_4]